MARFALRAACIAVCLFGATACATVTPQTKDYTAFRSEDPRSILVVPALNNSINIPAPDIFLSTISRPFSERGYYVFPAYMVKRLLEEDGLADAGLVHNTDSQRLQPLFGCDTVLYVTIQRWESQYVVLSSTTSVEFDYTLKSCETGETLWSDNQAMVYSPDSSGNSSGNVLADLIAQAIVAAIEKGAPNYLPLTMQANALAAGAAYTGLPAGPYRPEIYRQDGEIYPSGTPAP